MRNSAFFAEYMSPWIHTYMFYVKLIDRHFLVQASDRRRKYNMYLYILSSLTHVFFAFNQPNYACWSTRYHNLLQVSQTHPGLEEMMRENGIRVRRTPKSHSTRPFGLFLKETVNYVATNFMWLIPLRWGKDGKGL